MGMLYFFSYMVSVGKKTNRELLISNLVNEIRHLKDELCTQIVPANASRLCASHIHDNTTQDDSGVSEGGI